MISSLLPLSRGPPLGAEPRFELGPALQQADDAILSGPRRNLTEPRRTLNESRRTLTEPGRTLTEPGRNPTEPHRSLTEPRRTLTEPRRNPCSDMGMGMASTVNMGKGRLVEGKISSSGPEIWWYAATLFVYYALIEHTYNIITWNRGAPASPADSRGAASPPRPGSPSPSPPVPSPPVRSSEVTGQRRYGIRDLVVENALEI